MNRTAEEAGLYNLINYKEIEKAGKLANDLNGYNKKNKLGLSGLRLGPSKSG